MEPLKPEALRRVCDPQQFDFDTTAELEELTEAIGQARAAQALSFGVRMPHKGYNLFALGPTGMGKHYVVRQFLEKIAADRPAPSDWCYVHNFKTPHQPMALEMPSGQGAVLREVMEQWIEEVKSALAAAFDGEDYRERQAALGSFLKERQRSVITEIEAVAAEENIAILRSPGGLALAPMDEGEVMTPDAFEALPAEERQVYEKAMEKYREQLAEALQQEPQWEREHRAQVRELNEAVAAEAIGHLVAEVMQKYAEAPQVLEYLKAVAEDVIQHAARLAEATGEEDGPQHPQRGGGDGAQGLERRYQVNVLVDHEGHQGAPVVYEDQPTVYNLIGRVEHHVRMGALMTDFSLIRGGALHMANGGYLILDALKLLNQPHAWQQLKGALRAGEIRTRSVDQLLDRATTVTIEPEPIPLDIKVVLIGERHIYDSLSAQDPDFDQLFKVAADFNSTMPRTAQNVTLYARLIATLARKSELMPLNRAAVAQVIDHVVRNAQDNEKLSIHIQSTSDLLREADFWARESSQEVIGQEHIQRALDAKRQRHSRVQEHIQEDMAQNVTLIDTDGGVVGQVNGLSVLLFGQVSFGRPNRITATVRLGKGEVVDIEREVRLGGPLHTKGIMILTGFLGSRYASDVPLSLGARIVMEQSYGGVDGDSATMAETCALLSALAGVPLRQDMGLTGSMNQFGQIQAIGGVNDKIEGFFDLCAHRGLTGKQGVIIPVANVHHLMLRPDVAQAAQEGKFAIYAVETVDQALGLLTGMTPGKMGEDGLFEEGSFNRAVQDRVRKLAEQARHWQGR